MQTTKEAVDNCFYCQNSDGIPRDADGDTLYSGPPKNHTNHLNCNHDNWYYHVKQEWKICKGCALRVTLL